MLGCYLTPLLSFIFRVNREGRTGGRESTCEVPVHSHAFAFFSLLIITHQSRNPEPIIGHPDYPRAWPFSFSRAT